ncbi:MAG: hypothetical protein CMC08_02645 [Flavobacteriaceae bacterium]|nr:hypothetical protein [Flavobacteriaceae bacterium]
MEFDKVATIYKELLNTYSPSEAFTTQCWENLQRMYSAPERHYHNLGHIAQMLDALDASKARPNNRDTLLFSIYYHDCIHVPGRSDNERQSAQYMRKSLSETRFSEIEACHFQIMGTKHHLPSTCSDTNLLLDLDLSILGADARSYDTYRRNIRKEFRAIPQLIYRAGRKAFIKSYLKRERIYKSKYFLLHYEDRARANLKRELASLG